MRWPVPHASPCSRSIPSPSSYSIASQLIHLILPFFFFSSSLSFCSLFLLLLFPPPQVYNTVLCRCLTGEITHPCFPHGANTQVLPPHTPNPTSINKLACSLRTPGPPPAVLQKCRQPGIAALSLVIMQPMVIIYCWSGGVSAAAAATVRRRMRHHALREQVPFILRFPTQLGATQGASCSRNPSFSVLSHCGNTTIRLAWR